MTRLTRVTCLGMLAWLLGGCTYHANLDMQCDFPPACCGNGYKGPKTLLEWAECKKEEDKTAKANGDGTDKKDGTGEKADLQSGERNGTGENDNGGNGEEEDTITTDRPDFTEASSTVGKGRVQLEAGYTFLRSYADGVTTRIHSYPESLFRIGLFADWFELRIGQNFFTEEITAPNARLRVTGAADLYLGVKLALTEQKECLPETALILQTFVPSGADELTFEQLLPGVSLLFSWELVPDFLSLAGSVLANRLRDDAEHYHVELAQSLSLGYQLTRRLGAYTEWFAFYPTGAIHPDARPRHFADGGFTYLVNNNFQLDIRAGVGLNRRVDTFFAGTGFAVRF